MSAFRFVSSALWRIRGKAIDSESVCDESSREETSAMHTGRTDCSADRSTVMPTRGHSGCEHPGRTEIVPLYVGETDTAAAVRSAKDDPACREEAHLLGACSVPGQAFAMQAGNARLPEPGCRPIHGETAHVQGRRTRGNDAM